MYLSLNQVTLPDEKQNNQCDSGLKYHNIALTITTNTGVIFVQI